MALARYPSFVLDCDDPGRLAEFYGALLDWRASSDDGWGEVRNEAGEQAVVELGATLADHQPGTTFRVFLDPAGHPFCLCVS